MTVDSASPRRGVDGESTGVAEEVQEAFPFRFFAYHGSGDAVVQEQACVDVVGQVDLEFEPPLVDDEQTVFVAYSLVLSRAALPLAAFAEDLLPIDFECVGRRAGHEVQPVGVLGRGAIVRTFVFGDMEAVFIAVHDEWNLRFVSLVEPVARNALLTRPAPQVACPLDQPIPEDLGLFQRLLGETRRKPERSVVERSSGGRVFPGSLLSHVVT